MNVGIPPRSRNHRLPAACDAPTASAASSLVSPFAISRQNNRSTSRRNDGAPGDLNGALPVNSRIQPAGLPIATPLTRALRRPVESAQYTSGAFNRYTRRLGVRQSMGRTGVCWDNAQAETFFASLKVECVYRTAIPTLDHARRTIGRYIEIFYNRRRRHSALDYQTPQQRYSELTRQQAQAA